MCASLSVIFFISHMPIFFNIATSVKPAAWSRIAMPSRFVCMYMSERARVYFKFHKFFSVSVVCSRKHSRSSGSNSKLRAREMFCGQTWRQKGTYKQFTPIYTYIYCLPTQQSVARKFWPYIDCSELRLKALSNL